MNVYENILQYNSLYIWFFVSSRRIFCALPRKIFFPAQGIFFSRDTISAFIWCWVKIPYASKFRSLDV